MLKRLFPHPYLTLTLIVLWFLLVNQWKIGSRLYGAGPLGRDRRQLPGRADRPFHAAGQDPLGLDHRAA
jgi:hypothetical protein